MKSTQSDIDGPRACSGEELPELLELVNYVFRTSRGKLPSIPTDYPQIYTPDNLEFVRLIRAEGKIRACVGMYPSMIALGDVTLSSAGINCTTTHPDYRRRGFGGMLMRDAYRVAETHGMDFVHLSPGVPEWYRRFDLEYGGCACTYILDRGNIEALPELSGVIVDTGFDEYVERVHAIHTAERVGNIRSLEQTKLVLPRVPAELYVALTGGEVEAYVYIRKDSNLCIEHGGPSERVAGLLREVFRIRDDENSGVSTSKREGPDNAAVLKPQISFVTGPLYQELFADFEKRGIPVERKPWHMIHLTDPAGLLGKLGPDDIEVTESDGEFVLKRGGRVESFSRRSLTKLIFGPERISDIVSDRLPLPVFTPLTDHV